MKDIHKAKYLSCTYSEKLIVVAVGCWGVALLRHSRFKGLERYASKAPTERAMPNPQQQQQQQQQPPQQLYAKAISQMH